MKNIYFLSDAHLGSRAIEHGRTHERRLVNFLDSIKHKAEAIYLLGDMFDFWYEFKLVVPKGYTRFLGKISELTDMGVEVHYFVGNHDMWCGDYLEKECGVKILFKPQRMTLAGKELFIAHGDNMNIGGQWVLQAMNAMFRSKALKWLFSWFVHPDWALRFGHWWSGHSRKQHAMHDALTESITEPLIAYARDYDREHEVDGYLFGHMHYARDYRDEGLHVVLLGAWDCYPSYAVLDKEGNLTLKKLDL